MSTSVPALLRSTTETEYLAPENTPASAADAWAVRSRSGWAGAGTAALNMLRDADWERTLPDPDLSEKLSSEEPSSATLPSVGSTVAPDRAAPADETLPDEPSPSFEHPRTDNSTTIVTTENIAISTVRRRRTYVSSRVDIIRPPDGFARRRGPTRPPACVTMPRRIRPVLRRGGRICFAIEHLPDRSHRRPHCNPRTKLVRGEHPTLVTRHSTAKTGHIYDRSYMTAYDGRTSAVSTGTSMRRRPAGQ